MVMFEDIGHHEWYVPYIFEGLEPVFVEALVTAKPFIKFGVSAMMAKAVFHRLEEYAFARRGKIERTVGYDIVYYILLAIGMGSEEFLYDPLLKLILKSHHDTIVS